MTKQLKTIILATTTLLALTTQSLAVEVTEQVTINSSVSTVWSKLGSWCAIKDWHPVVADCKEQRKGDELRRVLTLGDGAQIIELLTAEDEHSYSYVIESSPLPVEDYKSTISVKADGKNKTIFTWTSTFKAKGKTDKEAAGIIKGVYDAGLKAVEKDMN